MESYDLIIVGAGPAGIFTALKCIEEEPSMRILMLEKGSNIEGRVCPTKVKGGSCSDYDCATCAVVSGWGGAGAFSDGKLTLSPEIGGNLANYIGIDRLQQLIPVVDDIYLRFGAPEKVYAPSPARVEEIQRRAVQAELKLIPSRIRHLGTGYSTSVLREMRDYLLERGVEIRVRQEVTTILAEEGEVRGVELVTGERIFCQYLALSPGRENAEWLSNEAEKLGLNMNINPVDIGVRVEVPAVVMKEITDDFYEFKLLYYSQTFDDLVRTFCMCPGGEVVNENNQGLYTVNGHSHSSYQTEYTNFALLVSKTFTEPFREPITYGRYIAHLANLLGGGVLVQRLGDLLEGQRSTLSRMKRGIVEPTLKEATPGDLSLVLPYRHLISITEMIKALDKITPGVYSRHTLLYGVEVKFYSSRIEVDQGLKTEINNFYVGGDGAGITRGLVQASVSGMVIAESILKNHS